MKDTYSNRPVALIFRLIFWIISKMKLSKEDKKEYREILSKELEEHIITLTKKEEGEDEHN